MNLNLDGKTALVTGSSRGIGKAIAISLHNEGCNVVLNGLTLSKLKDTAKDLGKNVSHFVTDVTDPHACEDLVQNVIKQYGSLDILVCNVGNGSSVKPGEESLEEWHRMMNVNLYSATNIIKASTNELVKSKGSIVCISSITGIEAVETAPVTYSSSKAALNAYVRGISRYLAKYGIRINAVAPGNIIFEGSIWEKKTSEDPVFVQKILDKVPLKRFGKAEEIADFVSYLASPKADFVTGQIFVVDGGQIRS